MSPESDLPLGTSVVRLRSFTPNGGVERIILVSELSENVRIFESKFSCYEALIG